MLKIFPLVCDLSTAVIPVLRRPGQIILFCAQLPCCLIIFLWSISNKNCSCPIHLQYLGQKHFKYLFTRVKLSPIDYSICMTFMFLAKCKIHVSRTTSKCIKQCKKKLSRCNDVVQKQLALKFLSQKKISITVRQH